MRFEAIFAYRYRGFAKEKEVTITVYADNDADATHRIEVAFQRLVDGVDVPAERPGQQWGVWLDTRWALERRSSEPVWLNTRTNAEAYAKTLGGVAKPYPERVAPVVVGVRTEPTRDDLVKALRDVLAEHDELSDAIIVDHGKVPDEASRNYNPDVAAARNLLAMVIGK